MGLNGLETVVPREGYLPHWVKEFIRELRNLDA